MCCIPFYASVSFNLPFCYCGNVNYRFADKRVLGPGNGSSFRSNLMDHFRFLRYEFLSLSLSLSLSFSIATQTNRDSVFSINHLIVGNHRLKGYKVQNNNNNKKHLHHLLLFFNLTILNCSCLFDCVKPNWYLKERM